MFDQILELVKEHMGNNPQIAAAIPADQQDAIHNEIANHVANSMPQGQEGGLGGLLSGLTSGGGMASAIEGGLVSTLASKFGLPPEVTGAISASLPGLLSKFTNPGGATHA